MTPKIMFIKSTTKTTHIYYLSTYVDIQMGNVEKKKSFIWINRLFRFGKMKKDNNKQQQKQKQQPHW